jgi:recombination protein RecA
MSSNLTPIERKIAQYKKEQLVYSGVGLQSLLVPRISTGIFIMDLLTGGGVPEGRITEFYGAKGSTKSSTALRVAGNYLRQTRQTKKRVTLVDFEGTFDEPWSQRFMDAEDMDRFDYVLPDYGEQGVDIIKTFAENDPTGLIIVDSVAMMVPMAELEGTAVDQHMGLQAKLLNRLFRFVFPHMIARRRSKDYLTLLVINQLRANIGKFGFQSPTIKPGGYLQDFLYSLDLQFYTLKQKEVGGLPVQSTHQFTVQKNKLGLQKRSGEYVMRLISLEENFKAGGIDEAETIFKYARKAGVITPQGKGWLVGGETLGKIEDVVAYLQDDEKAKPIKAETLKRCYQDVLLTGSGGADEKSV